MTQLIHGSCLTLIGRAQASIQEENEFSGGQMQDTRRGRKEV